MMAIGRRNNTDTALLKALNLLEPVKHTKKHNTVNVLKNYNMHEDT